MPVLKISSPTSWGESNVYSRGLVKSVTNWMFQLDKDTAAYLAAVGDGPEPSLSNLLVVYRPTNLTIGSVSGPIEYLDSCEWLDECGEPTQSATWVVAEPIKDLLKATLSVELSRLYQNGGRINLFILPNLIQSQFEWSFSTALETFV
jgi:hypothetical protein